MRLSRRIAAFAVSLTLVLSLLCSCVESGLDSGDIPSVRPVIGMLKIEGEESFELELGETRVLIIDQSEAVLSHVRWSVEGDAVSVDERGAVIAEKLGSARVTASYGALSDGVTVTVVEKDGSGDDTGSGDGSGSGSGDGTGDGTGDGSGDDGTSGGGGDGTDEDDFGAEYSAISVSEALALAAGYTDGPSVEKFYLVVTIGFIESATKGEMDVYDETGTIYVYKSALSDGSTIEANGIEVGDRVVISGTLRNYRGTLEVQTGEIVAVDKKGGTPDIGGEGGSGDDGTSGGGGDGSGDGSGGEITYDPYADMTESEFYQNYSPATSYLDSYYRTLHGFMSGSLTVPDAAPVISEYQPSSGGRLIKNTVTVFLDNGNTYVVYDAWGVEAFRVYRGGGYITLEEVAAHMYAFGTTPANHSSSKSTRPTSSIWGEYLRVNHTKFSGDTSKYKYEPVLPDISGCGGSKIYYEMDIGTTGTDTGGGYEVRTYNNGSSIVRGAARIVHTWKDGNGNGLIDAELGEVYVFYTYNHYNDFQEYLNYEGGWGEMFGNITGGGTLSSNTDYNPTPYVPVAFGAIGGEGAAEVAIIFVPIFSDKRA